MKLALTSCSKIQEKPKQPAWKAILNEKPDLLLMLGDNVYGGSVSISWKKYHQQLESLYQKQLNQKGFKKLTKSVPFKAIWDDNDFAKLDNGKGAEVKGKHKNKSRELFHQYMNCSTNVPEVYYSFEKDNAKFIMLDVRYYREKPSKTASILGKKQEQWLKAQLNHTKLYTIICSGTTLTSGKRERWENYQEYYKKFSKLAKKANHVIFLSGDIHKNKFVMHDGFFEVISSGVARKDLDNFATVDLKKDQVDIKFSGNTPKENHSVIIDTKLWKTVSFA